MSFENLTEREKQILYNLISYYVDTADPVGSRVIANKFGMGISSATIRNTLQDLEEMGLVQQPHTSAGRVPTDLGYRVYVDYFLQPEQLSQVEQDRIRNAVLKEGRGINEILGQTCKILGEITNQLGVTIAPSFESGIMSRLELIPVGSDRIMLVVVVKSGLAKSLILEIEASVSETQISEVEQVLNERLVGLTLGQIKESISKRLHDVSGNGRLINLVIDSKEKIWSEDSGGGIYVSGSGKLVQQPEFANTDTVVDLMRLIEDGRVLSEFLNASHEEGIVITIGHENKINEITNCSLVTSSYKVGNVTGTIGIMGPTRMPYNKLVSVVQCTARTIGDVLSGMNKESK